MTSTPKTGMRKVFAGVALAGALAIPAIALAAPSSAELVRNSDAYSSNPGVIHLSEVGGPGNGAQNGSSAGSGAFGSLTGPDYNAAGGRRDEPVGIQNSRVAGSNPKTG